MRELRHNSAFRLSRITPDHPDGLQAPGLACWLRPLTAVLTISLALGTVGVHIARPGLCPASDPLAWEVPRRNWAGALAAVGQEWMAGPMGVSESVAGFIFERAVTAMAATLLLLILPFWVVKSALASASSPNLKVGSISISLQSPEDDIHRIRVIAFSLAAAALSALACINWALAFVVSLLLLLIALLAWPAVTSTTPLGGSSRSTGQPSFPNPLMDSSASLSILRRDMEEIKGLAEVTMEEASIKEAFGTRALWLAMLSPLTLLCAYGLIALESSLLNESTGSLRGDDQRGISQWVGVILPAVSALPGKLLELQCRSHVAVLWMFWGLYLPLWVIAAMAY